jgi:hypothetical protein
MAVGRDAPTPLARIVIVVSWIALLWAVLALAFAVIGAGRKAPPPKKPPKVARYSASSASRTLRKCLTCSSRSRSSAPTLK